MFCGWGWIAAACGTRTGVSRAMATTMVTTPSAKTAPRWRAYRAHSDGPERWCPGRRSRPCASAPAAFATLPKSDLRVEVPIHDVGDQVEHDHEDRDSHDQPHQHRVVGPRGILHEQAPHARPGKDLLRDQRAREDARRIQGHERDK